MERGEGSNQLPDLNKSIDAIPPTSVKTEGEPSFWLVPAEEEPSNAPVKRGRGRPKSSQSSTSKLKRSERLVSLIPYTEDVINQKDQENGNNDLVASILMRFNAVKRRLSQAGVKPEVSIALETFKRLQLSTNQKKRVGSVPGVSIGDIFFSWGEMGLVGLHSATVGVEFIGIKESREDNPLAVCIVSTGENADQAEDPDTLIYTGFGGTEKFHGPADQKLERINLSLETSMMKKSVVRVIRATKDKWRTSGTIYIYDGIYSITDIWIEKGKTGFDVFKFKLVRESDQKPGFGTWKSVDQWKNGLVTRPGLIFQDLSNGAENLKVSLVNKVDGEKGPALFTYTTSLKETVINVPPMVDCCSCRTKSCSSRAGNCLCVERNEGGLPYVEGILVTRRPIIFECGGSCHCSADCKNKMIHTGLKFNFEVFKTVGCGWGLRSWDPIRAGSFLCEYAGGILIEKSEEEEDDYIFDTSRVYKSFRWNYEPELVGEDPLEKVVEERNGSSSLVISAKKSGNVARFMNHSCSPNVFWQTIAREQNGLWCIHIGFFAMKHIPPLTELRYDYGAYGGVGKKMCLCRSQKCRGSFG